MVYIKHYKNLSIVLNKNLDKMNSIITLRTFIKNMYDITSPGICYIYCKKYDPYTVYQRLSYCSLCIQRENALKLKSRALCSTPDNEKNSLLSKKDCFKKEIKVYLEHNKGMFKETERKLKMRKNVILEDIKETSEKVKQQVENIIEKENIYTIPNLLCVSRILVSPYLGMLIVQAEFNFALAVLCFASFTDLLDGWIARTWEGQSSKMGSFLDPMADKILIATLFLTLTYARLIPIELTSLIIARDVLLVAAGFVIRYRSLPPPRTLSRYFDVTHATAQLAPTFISKINTGVQLLLVGSTLAAPVFHYIGHPLLECLWYITGATTIAGGISYLVSKNTYRILKKSK